MTADRSSFLPSPRLSELTTLCLGGPAARYVRALDDATIAHALSDADARGERVLVLGGGSNLVVSDDGFDGLVLHIATRGVTVHPEGERVVVDAAAGEGWDALVARCVADDLAGIECLSGIPGSVGATPIQNVGAYGQEVADTLVSVRVWDRHERRERTLSAAECELSYRDSAFKRDASGRHVVLGVRFALRPGGGCPVRYAELRNALGAEHTHNLTRVRDTVIALRRNKGMVLDPSDPETRSAGSFFTNPIVSRDEAAAVELRGRARGVVTDASPMPRWEAGVGRVKLAAGWLIERAGVARGMPFGRVGVSSRHSLALVNRDGGSAAELVALAREVKRRVRDAFGVELRPEPVFEGFSSADPTADAPAISAG